MDDDIVASGAFQGTVTLGGASLVASGTSDLFVARFHGADGSHVWSFSHGGSGNTLVSSLASDGSRIFVGGSIDSATSFGGETLSLVGSEDAFVAAYNVADGTHVWSESLGGMGTQANTESIAASSSRLAMAVQFHAGPITIGASNLTLGSMGTDVALVRLNLTTGLPSATVSQFESTTSGAGCSLALTYTDDRLAGVGAFPHLATLLGTQLISAGGSDVASFRVDF